MLVLGKGEREQKPDYLWFSFVDWGGLVGHDLSKEKRREVCCCAGQLFFKDLLGSPRLGEDSLSSFTGVSTQLRDLLLCVH